MTKSKDNDKGSRSKIAKHEGTSLQRRQRQRSQELNNKSNLNELTKECHNELTSGEIDSLKILSRTRKSLQSHLQVLSNKDLKDTRTEHGFKRAFTLLFGQDVKTFTSMMFLYVDQLEKQLDKEELQEDGSMAAFWMTNKSFSEYTRIKAKDFKDTLLKHMSSVKKSIVKRARHERQYDRRVNETQMQMQEGEVNRGKALDADLIVLESSRTESEKHDTSSKSRNDTHAEDAYINTVNDKEPMAE
nr:hypothetical protein [Tanacetum cinerariifolium]